MQPTSQQTTSRPVPAPPSYSSEYSQFPRPVLPAQSAAPAAESKTNPFTAEYRDPYAATPTLDRPRSRESLDVPRPPSESSNRSRSPSPVPDPEHARNERYASEFEAQRRVWEGGKREAGQVGLIGPSDRVSLIDWF